MGREPWPRIPRAVAVAAPESLGVIGQHAVSAPAVGDDLKIAGQLLQVSGELVGWKRPAAGNAAGGEPLGRADHDDHGPQRPRLAQKNFARHLVDVVRPQVRSPTASVSTR